MKMKAYFFEMVATDPLLQARIASKVNVDIELIELLAEEKNSLISSPPVTDLILENYNSSMPAGKKITKDDLFELDPVWDACFTNDFVELMEL